MARRLVESEVPGTVTRVACSEGARVARDDPIVAIYLVMLIYLLWPVIFNLAGRLFTPRSGAASRAQSIE